MTLKLSRKRITVIIIAVVVIAIMAAGSYFSVITPKIPNPNKFTFAAGAEGASLDPQQTYSNEDARLVYLMYDRLVTFRGSGAEPQLMLATSYQASDNGLVWTFQLRQGAKFHDGTPLDAKAVEFSFWRAMKKGISTFLLKIVIDENSTKAIGTYTVQFTLKQKFAPFIAVLAGEMFSIVSPKVMEHDVKGDLGQAWLAKNEAGSGPFSLKEYVASQRIVLSAVRDYWGGAPKIDEMDVLIVPDGSTERLMLERGEIDGAEDIPAVAQSDLKKSQNFKVIDNIGFYQQGVILNTQGGPLKDVRVRKAIAYAIDYEGILSTVFFGQAERLANPIPKGFPSYDASVPTLYSYDMDKAKALINEAGYSNGFEARFLIYAREDWVKIATIIQSSLSKLNIKVNVQQFAQSTYYTMRRQGQFELAMQDWSPDYADPDNLVYPFYYSKNAGAASNYSRYNGTRVDQLILNARTEYDQAKRFQMYSEIQKIIIDEAPIVWMLQARGYRGLTLRSWVQGYAYNPVAPWSLPAELYKA